MEVPNISPVEPQPAVPTLAATQPKPIDLSTAQSAIAPQPLLPEPLPVQPQPVQPIVSAPPPQPFQQSQQIPSQQQPPISQPPFRLSRRMFLLFGLVIVILYIIGFGGAWAYSRFFKTKQIPTLDRERSNPVTFSAIAPNAYTEEQAIGAIKKAYPELKDVETVSERTNPRTFIRTEKTIEGWKVRFNRGYGECSDKYSGCQREQYYYFAVDSNGLVNKIGQVEFVFDPNSDEPKKTGTYLPIFFEGDKLGRQ